MVPLPVPESWCRRELREVKLLGENNTRSEAAPHSRRLRLVNPEAPAPMVFSGRQLHMTLDNHR